MRALGHHCHSPSPCCLSSPTSSAASADDGDRSTTLLGITAPGQQSPLPPHRLGEALLPLPLPLTLCWFWQCMQDRSVPLSCPHPVLLIWH